MCFFKWNNLKEIAHETKERIVLDMDCWRALTELDAQAKEYEEMKKTYSKG